MRLFWSPRSPFARKAMVVAFETGIADQIECITTIVTAETFNPDYASINPTGLLPTLQLDGRKVTQIWNSGVAEYRWQVTEYQPHFWHEGQALKIWDEMFSKYQRAANGQLVKLP